MQLLISILIAMLIFALVGWGLLWICSKYFPEFPPARWICGVFLLIVILLFLSNQFGIYGEPFRLLR